MTETKNTEAHISAESSLNQNQMSKDQYTKLTGETKKFADKRLVDKHAFLVNQNLEDFIAINTSINSEQKSLGELSEEIKSFAHKELKEDDKNSIVAYLQAVIADVQTELSDAVGDTTSTLDESGTKKLSDDAGKLLDIFHKFSTEKQPYLMSDGVDRYKQYQDCKLKVDDKDPKTKQALRKSVNTALAAISAYLAYNLVGSADVFAKFETNGTIESLNKKIAEVSKGVDAQKLADMLLAKQFVDDVEKQREDDASNNANMLAWFTDEAIEGLEKISKEESDGYPADEDKLKEFKAGVSPIISSITSSSMKDSIDAFTVKLQGFGDAEITTTLNELTLSEKLVKAKDEAVKAKDEATKAVAEEEAKKADNPEEEKIKGLKQAVVDAEAKVKLLTELKDDLAALMKDYHSDDLKLEPADFDQETDLNSKLANYINAIDYQACDKPADVAEKVKARREQYVKVVKVIQAGLTNESKLQEKKIESLADAVKYVKDNKLSAKSTSKLDEYSVVYAQLLDAKDWPSFSENDKLSDFHSKLGAAEKAVLDEYSKKSFLAAASKQVSDLFISMKGALAKDRRDNIAGFSTDKAQKELVSEKKVEKSSFELFDKLVKSLVDKCTSALKLSDKAIANGNEFKAFFDKDEPTMLELLGLTTDLAPKYASAATFRFVLASVALAGIGFIPALAVAAPYIFTASALSGYTAATRAVQQGFVAREKSMFAPVHFAYDSKEKGWSAFFKRAVMVKSKSVTPIRHTLAALAIPTFALPLSAISSLGPVVTAMLRSPVALLSAGAAAQTSAAAITSVRNATHILANKAQPTNVELLRQGRCTNEQSEKEQIKITSENMINSTIDEKAPELPTDLKGDDKASAEKDLKVINDCLKIINPLRKPNTDANKAETDSKDKTSTVKAPELSSEQFKQFSELVKQINFKLIHADLKPFALTISNLVADPKLATEKANSKLFDGATESMLKEQECLDRKVSTFAAC